MFVSHGKNINKRKFQKPNILRRKSKVPSVKLTFTAGSGESPETKSLLSPIIVNESKVCDVLEDKGSKRKNSKPVHNLKKISTRLDDIIPCEVQISTIERNKFEVNAKNIFQCVGNNTLIASQEETEGQNTVNVESFLVSGAVGENIALLENEIFQPKAVDIQGNQKWSFDFTSNTSKIILEECDGTKLEGVYLEQKPDVITTMVPLSAVSAVQQMGSYIVPAEQISEELTVQKLSVDQFFTKSHMFKCEVIDCDKEFMTEQKLKKHRTVHNKDGNNRVHRQTTVECPVKKILEDGTEESCGIIFQMREDLMKHLNEEHKPEDAVYRCDECGRRFFWASGLRAHGRAHRSRRPRAALACAWPGCGRVFRQPCRLREHTRAHTGDKPYPCRYPNCGWSFRTASKLVRHARRHTGERRHACAACGRAFLRREHLRDHAARHHAARAPARCTHRGCEQSFSSTSSLYMHAKKVHCEDEDHNATETTVPEDTQSILKTDPENIYMIAYMPESPGLDAAANVEVEPEGAELSLSAIDGDIGSDVGGGAAARDAAAGDAAAAGGAGAAAGDGHAARTHCTWPLPPRAHAFEHSDAYVLEEDAQVEHSEISENNIYTVRSDLFLHGNVLTNEDSEHMAGERAGCGAAALDAELLLAPSVDLAQEELYTDAVDESAFRVFLLSGEDLT